MYQVKTDNSHLKAKISLRLNHLPEKENFSVIDAFSGGGHIWQQIKHQTGREIDVLRIDQKPDAGGIYLKGDNRKFIESIGIENFDVIDLDAYGVCFDLLDWIIKQDSRIGTKHKIFLTYNQSMFGGLPKRMLNILGYTDAMIEKIPTLFNKHGVDKLKAYLSMMGISKIFRKSSNGRNYIFFET